MKQKRDLGKLKKKKKLAQLLISLLCYSSDFKDFKKKIGEKRIIESYFRLKLSLFYLFF